MFRMTVESFNYMQGQGFVVSGPAEGTCRLGEQLAVEGAEPPRLYTIKGFGIPRPGVRSILIDLDEKAEARKLVGQSLVLHAHADRP